MVKGTAKAISGSHYTCTCISSATFVKMKWGGEQFKTGIF